MKKFYFLLLFLSIIIFTPNSWGQTYHLLSGGTFLQNWSDAGLITANDVWTGVPSIIGYRGDDITASTGADPQTLLGEGSIVIDVNANQTNPAVFATGGPTEFAIADPVVALSGSGTADAPNLIIYLNTTGMTNINVSYNLRDIDGSVDNCVQAVALQYRVGTTGNFTNIPAAFVSDASSGPSLATLVTNVSVILPAGAENASQVQIRIITSNAAGNDEWIGIDDISISGISAVTPSIALSSPSQVGDGYINTGATNQILSKFQAAITTSNATLNALTFSSDGTYEASDITNFKLYFNSSNDFASASLLQTLAASLEIGSHSFTSLSQVITSGSTGYFWITCDVISTATADNTINIAAEPSLTFSTGVPTGTIAVGGTQTIKEVAPDILINSLNPAVSVGDIIQNTSNNVIYRFDIAVTTANATLAGLQVTTAGTYTASNLTNLKAWYSADATFNAGSDVLLSTKSASLDAGIQVFPSWTNQVISSGTTGYVFITTDIPCGAASGASISVSAVATSDVTFLTGSKSGTTYAGGTQTIQLASASNVTNPTTVVGNSQITLNWTNSTDCYNEIMIVAKSGLAITGTPSGDGSAYAANLSFGTAGTEFGESDGYIVYKGSLSSQIVTSLTNGTVYYFKYFTRNGTNWSSGTEINSTPNLQPELTELVVPKYIGSKTGASANSARTPIAICVQIDNLIANTNYDLYYGLGLTSEAPTSYGAGNMWNGSSFGIVAPSCLTNSSGSTGPVWIFFQPTGNATRFDAGNIHNLRLAYVTSGGSKPFAPQFVGSKTITALDIATTERTVSTADDGAFIKGSSFANGKYILVFDNISGAGDPLYSYQIRTANATNNLQSELPESINDVFSQSGTSVVGDYAVVIPIGANNPNGVRRIETRNSDNTIYLAATDDNGIWPSGANTTDITRRSVGVILNTDAPLPVELFSFAASVTGNSVQLNWVTTTEINNQGFDVERSADNSTWTKLAFIQGNGISNSTKSYSYNDNSVAKSGKYSYRLKQLDNDGSFSYSNTVEADFVTPSVFSLDQNFPNPFNPNTVITYAVPEVSNVKLIVYNAIGQTVKVLENGFKNAGSYKVSFNASELPSGIYFYRIDAGNFSQIKKMLLIK